MGSTKRIARVQHISLVRYIRPYKPYGEAMAEILPQRQIQRVVTRQMVGSIPIQESRSVVNGHSAKAAPRQLAFHPRRKRITLVMIQIEFLVRWRRKIGSPTRDTSNSLRPLIRVCQI